jgi:hypothetical protein
MVITHTTNNMKCPYQVNFGCPFVDTLDMTKSERCPECEYYDNGVRPTGAMPILGWITEKLRKLFKKKEYTPTDDDIFMMGL